MPKYTVIWRHVVEDVWELEADSVEDAVTKAEKSSDPDWSEIVEGEYIVYDKDVPLTSC